jgi:hypothetical protein
VKAAQMMRAQPTFFRMAYHALNQEQTAQVGHLEICMSEDPPGEHSYVCVFRAMSWQMGPPTAMSTDSSDHTATQLNVLEGLIIMGLPNVDYKRGRVDLVMLSHNS